jgi:hypothetical protein
MDFRAALATFVKPVGNAIGAGTDCSWEGKILIHVSTGSMAQKV